MKRSKEPTNRIRGSILAEATRQPIPGITVTASQVQGAKRAPLGRAVTAKDGSYELELERLPSLPDNTAATVALSLADGQGRAILAREQMLRVGARQDVRMDFALPCLEHGDDWPDIRYIEGEPVNIRAAASLRRDELIEAYRFLRGRGKQPKRLAVVRRAFPSLFGRRAPWDDCGEGGLPALRHFLAEKAGDADVDNSDADDLPAGATIHWFYTAKIQVKYTTDAAFPNDAVPAGLPAADSSVALSNGTVIGTVRANLVDLDPSNTEVAPAYVQQVGLIAEYALTQYLSATFGMRDPRNGAARLEYRIRQMPAGIVGQTSGSWSHVEVGPGNSLIQNLHTVPHEMFHQVQYRYNDTTTRSGMYGSLREGGARLIEDSINDQPNRWVDTASLIFGDPTQSLADSAAVGTAAGASTAIRYAAGLFWKYLAEQHSTHTAAADEPAIGIETYRKVLEAMATVLPGDPGVGYDPPALRTIRRGLVWYGRFDEFRYYDAALTELDSHETTWGNYVIANYLHGTMNPVADRRFEYRVFVKSCGWFRAPVGMTARSECRQHAGKDLEAQVFLVAEPVGAALEDADLVVQPLDEAERDLVVRAAVGGDPVPMPVDHRGELLVGPQALPLERRPPVLEEAAGPGLSAVVPELPERLLEQVRGVQALVGGEQGFEGPPAVEREILAVGQQRVLLPLDEPALPPGHAGVLALADLIEGVAEMPQDVELVEQNAGLRGVARGGEPEGLPHVHHREPEPGRFPGAQPGVELIQARLGAIGPAEPDRPLPDEITDDDPIGVALADRDLVEPDDPGAGRPHAAQLLTHVLLLERLHGVPVQAQFLGHVPDRRGPTTPPHVEGEPLAVEGIVGQEVEPFLFHLATAPAGHPPDLELQVDPPIATGEIADAAWLAVVPAALDPPARPTRRFFDRRVSVMMRARGSPKMPVTVGLGRNPGKRYASHSRRGRRGVGMRRSSLILAPPLLRFRPLPERLPSSSGASFHPLTSTKSHQLN